jgi:ABC-type Fe3+-hydroxamate transport system substrate-binding protein
MGVTFTDDLGTRHEVSKNSRILSLVPSITELFFDLGLSDQLVGRTQYCIHPADEIERIPSVGGTKKINMAKVKTAAPTHAILNVDENPKSMADDLSELGIQVIVTHPMRPQDNINLFTLIGGIFNRPEQAQALTDKFSSELGHLEQSDERLPKKVLYLIWKDPWMAVSAETYVANTLQLLNWQISTPGMLDGQTGDAARYPKIEITNENLNDVDLILFSSEPYSFDQTHISEFQTAFPDHVQKAHIIDGEMTSWYGSRAITGLSYLRTFAERL